MAAPMRRYHPASRLATLLFAPAAHADGRVTRIIRYCAHHGVLNGHYSRAQLRKARANLPADVDELRGLSDVFSSALAAAAHSVGFAFRRRLRRLRRRWDEPPLCAGRDGGARHAARPRCAVAGHARGAGR